MTLNTASASFNVFFQMLLQILSFIYMPSPEKKVWVRNFIFCLKPLRGYQGFPRFFQCCHIYINIFPSNPVWIDDEDGSEEEDEKGGRSVHKSNCCSRLQDRVCDSYLLFDFYPKTQVRSLYCLVTESMVMMKLDLLDQPKLLCYMDFSRLLHGFVKNHKKSQKDFSKLLHGIVKIDSWISVKQIFQSCSISRPLPNKTKMKFDQESKLVKAFALNYMC